jgi:HSP20 family protein
MNVIRYNPLDFEPVSFSSLVSRFLNDSLTRNDSALFVPRADIIENENSYVLLLAVPGLSKEDFNIELKNNVLTVSGERKTKSEKKDENFHSIETQYGTFSRSFTLPENVDVSKINAIYENGTLQLSIPKDEKKASKTTIKVG